MNLRRPSPAARGAVLVLIAVAMLLAGTAWAFARAGYWLVVSDRLERSDAIFVVQGGTPGRELGAAQLYREGLAPVVVVALPFDPVPREARLASGEPSLQELSVRVLEHVGVPPRAIVRLTREVDNTTTELDSDFDYARAAGLRRVILVTSPQHTRRVRVIWSMRYQRRIPGLVTPTPFERYDPRRWWGSSSSLEDTAHEVLGVANFLLGSPLRSYRDRP